MSLAISGGGPGWLLRAAIAAATACAAASAACLAWYSASPCLSSSDHDWTCAICAAWTRCGFLVCCITELRSKALSWVTATATERWAGGSKRGKITVTRIATPTSTARNSGSNPYCAPSLDSPYPWGGFSLSSERRRGEDSLRTWECATLTHGRQRSVAVRPGTERVCRGRRDHPRIVERTRDSSIVRTAASACSLGVSG